MHLRKPDIRFEILSAFEHKNIWEKVPCKYSSKEAIAKLHLYNYLALEESLTDNIKVLGNILTNDFLLYSFAIKYKYQVKSYEYLGLSGTFNSTSEEIDFSSIKNYTSWDVLNSQDRKNWKNKAEEPLKDFENYAY